MRRCLLPALMRWMTTLLPPALLLRRSCGRGCQGGQRRGVQDRRTTPPPPPRPTSSNAPGHRKHHLEPGMGYPLRHLPQRTRRRRHPNAASKAPNPPPNPQTTQAVHIDTSAASLAGSESVSTPSKQKFSGDWSPAPVFGGSPKKSPRRRRSRVFSPESQKRRLSTIDCTSFRMIM